MAAHLLALTLAEALFLAHVGASRMPVFYLLLAACSFPIATGFSQLADRLPRAALLRRLLAASGAAALALALVAGTGAPAGHFAVLLGVTLIELLVTLQFWLVVADYFTSLELKRIATPLAMATALGGLLGGGAASLAAAHVPPATVLFIVPGLYLLALVQVRRLERTEAPLGASEPEEAPAGLVDGLRTVPAVVRRHPIVLLIGLSALVAVVLRCAAEYQAFQIYERAYPDAQQLATFLGLVGGLLSVAELAVAFAITRPLIERLGVSGMNLVFPVTTLATLLGLAVSSRLPAAVAAQANYETLANSVYYPVENLDYNAVPQRFLGRVRGLTEGVFHPGGIALAGGLLLLAQASLSERAIAAGAVALGVGFLVVGYRVGRSYLGSLMELLRNRSVNLEDVRDGLVRLPPRYADEIRALLGSQDPAECIVGVELAARMGPAAFLPEIRALLPTADVPLRRALVRLYAAFRPRDLAGPMSGLLAAEDESLRELALGALLAAREPLDPGVVRRLLADPGPAVRGLACVAGTLGRLRGPGDAGLDAACEAVLGSDLPPAAHLAMIQGVRSLATGAPGTPSQFVRLLDGLLERAAVSVKDDALDAMAALRLGEAADREEVALAYVQHADPGVRAGAVRLLGTGRSPRALEGLAAALADSHHAVREAAAAALAAAGERALGHAEPLLASPRPDVVEAAIAAVGGVRGARAEDILQRFLEPGHAEAARNLDWLAASPAGAEWRPLRVALEDSGQRVTRRVLHVLAALGHGRPVACLRRLLGSPDERARADAVETLASLSPRRFVEPILPLLERQVSGEADRPSEPGADAPRILREALDSGDRWIVAGARAVLAQLPPLDGALRADRDLERSQPMNRVLFLKSVLLFRELSLDDLLILDAALVARDYLAGEVVFAEGSLGSDLGVVSRGGVAIRRTLEGQPQELARLGPGECFGEMALFDELPRSASVVAVADSTLLTLERGRFLTLVAQRPEVAMEVCKVLSRRLRVANERLGHPAADVGPARP